MSPADDEPSEFSEMSSTPLSDALGSQESSTSEADHSFADYLSGVSGSSFDLTTFADSDSTPLPSLGGSSFADFDNSMLSSFDFAGLLAEPSSDPTTTLSQDKLFNTTGDLSFGAGSSDLDAIFQGSVTHNGLEDLDFGELWASVKPLIDAGVDGPSEPSNSPMGAAGEHDAANAALHVDPAKLAGDMQSLFSGCLM
ncbi:hypothetical protein CERSUDRAFT_116061 [Gelatoporia subvermispora B]|uniref:Uncharacterized protein n=1 Tax=Ceriporiopsis subvermispora (strain B) TaxID=914234 RepID=M2PGT9_CERS8|nr:hypothetical protein CERSUDRAFT_116061 [Gelatoporia subvermispora B]